MRWEAFCFSMRGRKNKLENKPCQDNVRAWTDGDRACIVLSDGAGSALYSHIGSAVVVNTLVNSYRKNKEIDFKHILQRVEHNLRRKAKKLGVDTRELACTLIAVLIDGERYMLIHVGDGLAACMKEGGEVEAISEGFRGEFAGQTVFINGSLKEEYITTMEGSIDGIRAFYLMSDGMEHLLYDKRRKSFGGFVKKLYEWSLEENKTLLKKRIKKTGRDLFYQKTHDDLSICVLRRV